MRDLTNALAEWLEAGGTAIGEIHLRRVGHGFVLTHQADRERTDLSPHAGPEAARALATFDEEGKFRPLKTAPNLRRGWQVTVAHLAELRRALDYFYPAMVGVWTSEQCGALKPVTFRDTLDRQTGMYRITRKISDAQADALIGEFCRSDGGCLKRILWRLAPGVPITTLPAEKFAPRAASGELPLLCHEACHLLVGKAREVVKKTDFPA